MNIKNALIIVAIAVVIIAGVSLLFFKELIKENAPRSAAIPVTVVTKEADQTSYAIPANAIPSIGQIEENVKKAKAEQVLTNAMIAKVQADSALDREKIRAQLEAQADVPQVTTIAPKGNAAATTMKVAPPPTKIERAQMKARGVIAY